MPKRHRVYPALDPDAPLACDIFLSADAAQDARLAALRAHRSAPPEGSADGRTLRLRFRGLTWDLLEAFSEHERHCCAFAAFELEEHEGELILHVRARMPVCEFLRGGLAES